MKNTLRYRVCFTTEKHLQKWKVPMYCIVSIHTLVWETVSLAGAVALLESCFDAPVWFIIYIYDKIENKIVKSYTIEKDTILYGIVVY